MKRLLTIAVACMFATLSTDAAAQEIALEPHFTLDPAEEGDLTENDVFTIGGAVDLVGALRPTAAAQWLHAEIILGWRPTRDYPLGNVSGIHSSFGLRLQMNGKIRPGVFGRFGVGLTTLEQFDNTGSNVTPIWSAGLLTDVHMHPKFFFGFAVSWEQFNYGNFGRSRTARVEWVLASARLGWSL